MKDLLLLLVGHDQPVVDDRVDLLLLEGDRRGRGLRFQVVPLDEQITSAVAELGLRDVAKLVAVSEAL